MEFCELSETDQISGYILSEKFNHATCDWGQFYLPNVYVYVVTTFYNFSPKFKAHKKRLPSFTKI